MAETLYARIAPKDKRTGHVAERYGFHTSAGLRVFRIGRWYKVDHKTAAVLREEKHPVTGAHVFEVYDRKGYLAALEREHEADLASQGVRVVYRNKAAPAVEDASLDPAKAPGEASTYDGAVKPGSEVTERGRDLGTAAEVTEAEETQARVDAAEAGVEAAGAAAEPDGQAADGPEAPAGAPEQGESEGSESKAADVTDATSTTQVDAVAAAESLPQGIEGWRKGEVVAWAEESGLVVNEHDTKAEILKSIREQAGAGAG